MLELDLATLLFQVLNFLVLVAALNHFLFKPLRARLNERGKTVADILQDARDQETEAARLRSQWEERARVAEQRAEEILHQAEEEANQRSAAIMEDARRRLDELTEEMRADMARQRNELIVQHYDEILDTIVALSGNVVQAVTTRRTHDDLVTNFCASIYQLPQEEVEEYRRLMAGRVATAFVSTPAALTGDQAKTLTDTLSSLIDRRVELQIQTDPSLMAGIQVRLADKLIDNSIRQQLDRIRERVRQDLMTRMGAQT